MSRKLVIALVGTFVASIGLGCGGRVVEEPSASADTGVSVHDTWVTLPPPDSRPPSSDTMIPDTFLPPIDAPVPTVGCKGAGHLFCADFEGITKPTEGWTSLGHSDGASIDLSTDRSFSPKTSLKTTVTGTSDQFATLETTFKTGKNTGFRVDMRLYAPSVPTSRGFIRLLMVRDMSTMHSLAFSLDDSSTHWLVEAVGSVGMYPSTAPLPIAKWVHVRLEVALIDGGFGPFKVFLDDMSTPAMTGAALGSSYPSAIQLTVGPQSIKTSDVLTTYIDDVTFDFVP